MTPVTTISSDYLSLLDIWLRQSGPVIGAAPRVVCMDEAAHAALATREGVTATLAGAGLLNAPNRRAFWVRRLAVLRQVFDEDGAVLHSDADAFWLRNPAHLLSLGDLVVSTEQGLPKDIARRRGFVVCCGFIALRRTAATAAFFDAWQKECERRSDDQISINRLLDGAISQWQPFEVEGTTCHFAQVDFGGGPFRVVALSEALIAREQAFDVGPQAYVAHPFFERRFHDAYIALYDYLLKHGGLRSVAVPPPPPGMKRRDWAAYCQYKAMGDDLPQACVLHAAYLAAKAGESATALTLYSRASTVAGDALVDLFVLQKNLGRHQEAQATLRSAVRDRSVSDAQMARLVRTAVGYAPRHAPRLLGAAAIRFARPARAYAAVRRLYLKSTGAI